MPARIVEVAAEKNTGAPGICGPRQADHAARVVRLAPGVAPALVLREPRIPFGTW